MKRSRIRGLAALASVMPLTALAGSPAAQARAVTTHSATAHQPKPVPIFATDFVTGSLISAEIRGHRVTHVRPALLAPTDATLVATSWSAQHVAVLHPSYHPAVTIHRMTQGKLVRTGRVRNATNPVLKKATLYFESLDHGIVNKLWSSTRTGKHRHLLYAAGKSKGQPNSLSPFAVSADRKTVFVARNTLGISSTLYAITLSTGRKRQIVGSQWLTPGAQISNVLLSPTGKQLAVTYVSSNGAGQQIAVTSVKGGSSTKVPKYSDALAQRASSYLDRSHILLHLLYFDYTSRLGVYDVNSRQITSLRHSADLVDPLRR